MSRPRGARSQPPEENSSPVGESNADSENPTHSAFNKQIHRESANYDETAEEQISNQKENNSADENQNPSSSENSHMRGKRACAAPMAEKSKRTACWSLLD